MEDKERKLHWFVRLMLWLHKKLVIDRIKINVGDIEFPIRTEEEIDNSKRLMNMYLDSKELSSKVILGIDWGYTSLGVLAPKDNL